MSGLDKATIVKAAIDATNRGLIVWEPTAEKDNIATVFGQTYTLELLKSDSGIMLYGSRSGHEGIIGLSLITTSEEISGLEELWAIATKASKKFINDACDVLLEMLSPQKGYVIHD